MTTINFEYLTSQYTTNADASDVRRLSSSGKATPTFSLGVRRAAVDALIAAGVYRIDPATGATCKGGREVSNGCTCAHCVKVRAEIEAAERAAGG